MSYRRLLGLGAPACRRSLALALTVALLPTLASAPVSAAGVDYEAYHSVAETQAMIDQWARENASVEAIEIGSSAGGNGIWVVRIAAEGAVDPDRRPAIFVGANIAGDHNAGTEAALDLVETLLTDEGAGNFLDDHSVYVAPILNPDAHDTLFSSLHWRRQGNEHREDRDRDGLLTEDGADDLDGDGRITKLRIADPAGSWLVHPEDPRLLVEADSSAGRIGTHRVHPEGRDDDGDGEWGEDGPDGTSPDRNFAHAWDGPSTEAGPWPSFAPESQAIMDFLLDHRNIAAAVVYGPANNFLAAPQSLSAGQDLGTFKFDIPERFAGFLGLETDRQYTLDEVWEEIKDLPFIASGNVTKEQVASFLGAGPATKVTDGDQEAITSLAKAYKERLEEAGLAKDRPAKQYTKGGFTPWLYYQYGVLAVELDVWGVPKAEKKKEEGADEEEGLTLDRLEGMSTEEFLALDDAVITAFLEENNVPAQFGVDRVRQGLEGGQMDPPRMAKMIRGMGGGGGGGGDSASASEKGEDDPKTKRRREVLAWVEENAPEAWSDWTPVTLPDGTQGEVGGLDPFVEVAPPWAILKPALGVHSATVVSLFEKLARVELTAVDVEDLGAGVWQVRATVRNTGILATHTELDRRAGYHLPVRLELEKQEGVDLITGSWATTSKRLEGLTGTLEATWLIQASKGTEIKLKVSSDHAGTDRRVETLGSTSKKGSH